MDDRLQKLLDKDEIRDVMLRYCRGVDRRDWEAMRASFFEDFYDDHADFHGTRDEFVTWLVERHDMPGFFQSTHMLSNCLIEFASNTVAVVETYFSAKLELAADAGGHRAMLAGGRLDADASNLRVEVLGRYVDRFEKRSGQWRIARRHTVFDTTYSHPVAPGERRGAAWVLGQRGKDDPLYAVRAAAGLPAAHHAFQG